MKTIKCVWCALVFSAMSGVALAQNDQKAPDQAVPGTKKEELKGNHATPAGVTTGKTETPANGKAIDADKNAGGQTKVADGNPAKMSEPKKTEGKGKGKKEVK